MGSDTNLMVKAKTACKSTASQGFSFVLLLRSLIKSLLANAAWRRSTVGSGAFIAPGFQSGSSPLDEQPKG